MSFDYLDLFRISSFEFVILFILGVLCVFARVISFPISSSSSKLFSPASQAFRPSVERLEL